MTIPLSSILPKNLPIRAERSPLSEFHVAPTRILWRSRTGVAQAGRLLAAASGQVGLNEAVPPCTLTASARHGPAGVLLDFGTELHGYVELFAPGRENKAPTPLRIRFGESASEAMSELGVQGAQNDHALRDFRVALPWMGKVRVGPSGFRFVRIDALDPAQPASLVQVRAVLVLRDLARPGSFRCSDARLTRIWETGAYTVHLNMQDYLWDGIKRDRLVWIGDMHPEVSTINAVFGCNDVVPRSLDFTRDSTPADQWMNGISSYSMWWVLIHEQWWLHHGDRAYLRRQAAYLRALLSRLAALVGPDGRERIDGMRFLDWPSSPNPQGVAAGLQALLVMTLDAGARLSRVLGDRATAKLCAQTAARARPVVLDPHASKSGAALQVLAGQRDPRAAARALLKPGGARGVSTFYGYYVLNALGRAGEIDAALRLIRTYWGGMLDRGATTFWEDFDLAWLKGSGRIDELPTRGQKDLHGDFGAYCYEGFRHSLCHGWASGPTAWLSEYVLGIRPLAPGCARVQVAPQLGGLRWAEGSYPTPRGPIQVRHERRANGRVHSDITAPRGTKCEVSPA
jgi:hypothetical protein